MPDSVLSSLLRINHHRLRALRQALAPYSYVGVMHLIMFYTKKSPGASQEDIACFYTVDKASVARDAKRLEDMGHITRQVDPNNRRQYQLYLTEAGAAFIPTLTEAYDSFAKHLSAGIPEENWNRLALLLQQLEDHLREG